jgi:hypothetical protein
MDIITRRNFLYRGTVICAAPAIIRASSLMPTQPIYMPPKSGIITRTQLMEELLPGIE